MARPWRTQFVKSKGLTLHHIYPFIIILLLNCCLVDDYDTSDRYLWPAQFLQGNIDVYYMLNGKYITADGDDDLTMSKVFCEERTSCNLEQIISPMFIDCYYKGTDKYYYMILKTEKSFNNKHAIVKIDPNGIYWRDNYLDFSKKAKSVNPEDVTQLIYPKKKSFFEKIIDYIFKTITDNILVS